MILRDTVGNRLGTIETRADGVLVAKDNSGARMGEYDPHLGITRDRTGRRVGEGNLLASLLDNPLRREIKDKLKGKKDAAD